jgi:hypothetical protein
MGSRYEQCQAVQRGGRDFCCCRTSDRASRVGSASGKICDAARVQGGEGVAQTPTWVPSSLYLPSGRAGVAYRAGPPINRGDPCDLPQKSGLVVIVAVALAGFVLLALADGGSPGHG